MITLRTGLAGAQEYVPEFGGNREAADRGGKYWWVEIEPASKEEVAVMRSEIGRKTKNDERRATMLMDRIMRDRVVAVHGVTLELPNGERCTPQTGADMLDALADSGSSGEMEVIKAELLLAATMLSSLQEGLRKNLRAQSATSAPTTQVESGDATAARTPQE